MQLMFIPIHENHAIEEVLLSVNLLGQFNTEGNIAEVELKNLPGSKMAIRYQHEIKGEFKKQTQVSHEHHSNIIGVQFLQNSGEETNNKIKIAQGVVLENWGLDACNLTFVTTYYDNWNIVIEQFKAICLELASIYNLHYPIGSYTLVYRDRFKWKGNVDDFSISEGINPNSEYFPRKLMSRDKAQLIIDTSGELESNREIRDNLNISFSKELGELKVSHSGTRISSKTRSIEKSIEEKKFDDFFEQAHDYNKSILNDILHKSLIEIIHLNS
ncbi:hypothetical protein [Croceimicrobium sp.]|uniref:hypothetical protein n=1 Tax=Croceimicrobium sp. TaxID=2828340 RepID=UPI003BAC665F